jgi:serine O-acetyltransferase
MNRSKRSCDLRHTDALERSIDEIARSYEDDKAINNLESAALPNSRAVVEAFHHLKSAIYLGFYSTRPLQPANLRQTIAENLYPAYEILVEQIFRVLVYERNNRPDSLAPPPEQAEDVVLRLFDALPQLRVKLDGDVRAAFEEDPAAQSVEEVVFSYPSLEAITAYRVANLLYRDNVPMIPRIITEAAHSEAGIDIHPGARIGDNLFIDHGTGVVIGETSVIGDNVKIYQGVTLGALSLPRGMAKSELRNAKRHPTLEDDVTIYSGATILGGDTVIGRGSVIGGNVWLVESVPPYSKLTYRAGSGYTLTTAAPREGALAAKIDARSS